MTSDAPSRYDEPLGPHKRVSFSSSEELKAEADAYYADLKTEEADGIGGANVLLVWAIEHATIRVDGWSYVQQAVLMRPEGMGFRRIAPGEQPDELLEHVRTGRLLLESVLGGPTDESGHRD
jgi:hypothetical protein